MEIILYGVIAAIMGTVLFLTFIKNKNSEPLFVYTCKKISKDQLPKKEIQQICQITWYLYVKEVRQR